MIVRFAKLLILLFSITIVLAACQKSTEDMAIPLAPKNAIELMASDPELSMFAEATEMSSAEYYMNPGSAYTILAPSDSTFSLYLGSLGLKTVAELKARIGNESFDLFVRYHIIEGKVKTEDLADGYVVTFAELQDGDRLHCYFSRNGSVTHINKKVKVQTSIVESNAVVHKLNGVLSPLSLEGLVEVNPKFSKLSEVITFTKPILDSVLLNFTHGNHTLLAPTDEAFNLFINYYGYSDLSTLFTMVTKEQLADALKYHVIKSKVRAEHFQNSQYQTLLAGASLKITKDNSGTIIITDDKGAALIKILSTNIIGTNGVMHTIDKVLEFQ